MCFHTLNKLISTISLSSDPQDRVTIPPFIPDTDIVEDPAHTHTHTHTHTYITINTEK